MMRFLCGLGLISAAVSLAGCSGEPSGTDIDAAVKAKVERTVKELEPLGREFARSNAPTIHSTEKISCTQKESASTEEEYICDVEIDSSVPIAGRRRAVVKIAMVKVGDEWVRR